MMEPLWKQPSSGFESYFRNTVAQGYFKAQNYPDKNGQKVIMGKCCSRCLKPFDKLKRMFALMGTSTAVWQVQHQVLDATQQMKMKEWFCSERGVAESKVSLLAHDLCGSQPSLHLMYYERYTRVYMRGTVWGLQCNPVPETPLEVFTWTLHCNAC